MTNDPKSALQALVDVKAMWTKMAARCAQESQALYLREAYEGASYERGKADTYRACAESVEAVLASYEEELINQRLIGHGDGQRDAIADVNAGKIDDLITERLQRERAQLLKYTSHKVDCPIKQHPNGIEPISGGMWYEGPGYKLVYCNCGLDDLKKQFTK